MVIFLEQQDIHKIINRACPQGRVLSPPQWNVLINALSISIKSLGCRIIAFAHDITVVVTVQI